MNASLIHMDIGLECRNEQLCLYPTQIIEGKNQNINNKYKGAHLNSNRDVIQQGTDFKHTKNDNLQHS